jgi:hypothetical protein
VRTACCSRAGRERGRALALLGGTRDLWSELYDKNLSKLEMILWAVR